MALTIADAVVLANQDHSKLIRRLAAAEKVIKALLPLDTTSSDTIIERRLNQLEEIILEIPDSREDLQEEWNAKVVELWTKLASRGTQAVADEQKSDGSISNQNVDSEDVKLTETLQETSSAVVHSAVAQQPSSPPALAPAILKYTNLDNQVNELITNMKNVLSNKTATEKAADSSRVELPANSTNSLDLESFSPLEHPHLTKDDVRSMIAVAFSKFPTIVHPNDIEALRDYLTLVIRARNLVQLFWDDRPFETQLIKAYMLSKLPPERQQTFRNRPTDKQVFYGLIYVLQSALVNCHYIENNGPFTRRHGPKCCFYCKSQDHLIWKCCVILGIPAGASDTPDAATETTLSPLPGSPTRADGDDDFVEDSAQYTKELYALEAAIAELLSAETVNISALHKKLSHLLGAINRLPRHMGTLYNDWGDKAAAMMAHFATISMPSPKANKRTVS